MINTIETFIANVIDDAFNEESFVENKIIDDYCVENSKILDDTDPVFAYIAASKIGRILEFITNLTKEDAQLILSARMEDPTIELYGIPVTLAKSKQYDYGDDPQLKALEIEQKKAKATADAVNRSIKARQEMLVAEGVAKELEPKLSIRVK